MEGGGAVKLWCGPMGAGGGPPPSGSSTQGSECRAGCLTDDLPETSEEVISDHLVMYIRANVGMPRTLSLSMPPTLEPWIMAVPE